MPLAELEEFLIRRKARILRQCIDRVFESYPPETVGFLRGVSDRFQNPVGYTIASEMERLFDELLGRMDAETIYGSLDNIIRIRAVQEFPPSTAISFVFLIRDSVRRELGIGESARIEGEGGQLFRDILEFDHRIDRVAAVAFDIYARCREQIYQMKVKDLERRTRPVLRRRQR